MGEIRPIETIIALAEKRWPGLTLRRKSAHEASGPCPICKQATEDGWLCFDDGGWWCRRCGKSGWIDDNDNHPLTPQELTDIRLRALERKQEEHEKRLSALEKMARCTDHLKYHQLMDQDDRTYWHDQGMTDATIDKYLLGFCHSCPVAPRFPSYTIPVINGGKLVNIRHRLVTDSGDRYRPHAPGLGQTLFMADNVYKEDKRSILVLEGEKKALVVSQYGYDPVGIMGKAGFQDAWARRFEDFKRVYVALDPDAREKAPHVASLFGGRGWVVEVPVKADDFFTQYHGTPGQFEEFLRMARRVY